jgi:hypothetical protein
VGREAARMRGRVGAKALAFRSAMNVPLIRQAPPDTFSPGGEKGMAERLSPLGQRLEGRRSAGPSPGVNEYYRFDES